MKTIVIIAMLAACLTACTEQQLKGAGTATLKATCENHRDCTVNDTAQSGK